MSDRKKAMVNQGSKEKKQKAEEDLTIDHQCVYWEVDIL